MTLAKKRGKLTPQPSSLVIDIKPILALRNITQPVAYLLKIGLSNTIVNKILKNDMVQINLRQLTLLCTHLNCTPNELFARRNLNPLPDHELNKLRELSTDSELVSVTEWLKTKSLDEIKALMQQ